MLAQLKGPQPMFTPGPDFREVHDALRSRVLRYLARMAYMPEPVAKRVGVYIRDANLSSEDRLFPLCYSTAGAMIKNLGARLKMNITPHGLRRYSRPTQAEAAFLRRSSRR